MKISKSIVFFILGFGSSIGVLYLFDSFLLYLNLSRKNAIFLFLGALFGSIVFGYFFPLSIVALFIMLLYPSFITLVISWILEIISIVFSSVGSNYLFQLLFFFVAIGIILSSYKEYIHLPYQERKKITVEDVLIKAKEIIDKKYGP
jgi:general stress protein CsbA